MVQLVVTGAVTTFGALLDLVASRQNKVRGALDWDLSEISLLSIEGV